MNSSLPLSFLVDQPTSQPTTASEGQEMLNLRHNLFCSMNPQVQTHRYDQRPTAPRLQMIPRRPASENPVIAELMSTVAQAAERKRRHEEALYPKRHVGQQTGLNAEEDEEEEVFSETEVISQTKRFRVEIPPPPREFTTETVGINTSPSPTSPTTLSFNADFAATSSETPSTSSDEIRRRYRDTPAQRQARRSRRSLRTQQEVTNMLNPNNYQQQVTGMVPNDHSCTRCPHYPPNFQRVYTGPIAPAPLLPPTGPTSVSPTIAPTFHGHPLASPFTYYSALQTPLPAYTTNIPLPMMLGVVMPMATPQPSQPVLPHLHAPIPLRPTPNPTQVPQPIPPVIPPPSAFDLVPRVTLRPNTSLFNSEMMDAMLQSGYMLPFMSRIGLERHHLLASMDIDVPVGATKQEIEGHTILEKYVKKVEEKEEETCTVCLSEFEEGETIQKLRCEHIFHPECIFKWLEINKKCPMCRKEIDADAKQQQDQQPQ